MPVISFLAKLKASSLTEKLSRACIYSALLFPTSTGKITTVLVLNTSLFNGYQFPLHEGLDSDYFAAPLTKVTTQVATARYFGGLMGFCSQR